MSGDSVPLITLSMTIMVHLISTVWWAASLTRRVEHIERWIGHNEHTAAKLAALEQRLNHLGDGIARIEHFLRHHAPQE